MVVIANYVTLFPEPALLVGVEEGVHEVVAVILRYLERFRLYTLVQTL